MGYSIETQIEFLDALVWQDNIPEDVAEEIKKSLRWLLQLLSEQLATPMEMSDEEWEAFKAEAGIEE